MESHLHAGPGAGTVQTGRRRAGPPWAPCARRALPASSRQRRGSLPGPLTRDLLWSVSRLDTDLCSCAEVHGPWCCHARVCVCTHTRACSRLQLAKAVLTRDTGLQFSCDVRPIPEQLTSQMLWGPSLLSTVQRS